MSGISGLPIGLCISLLAIFAIIITLGGMKVIGYTDVVQVFFLIVGGLAATYFGLKLILISKLKEIGCFYFGMVMKLTKVLI